jgi:Zn-dependent M28 family amino/carboxypeptidase
MRSSSPWNHFPRFIDTRADRFETLSAVLEETGLCKTNSPPSLVKIAGNRHFFVSAEQQNLAQKIIVLAAHYDRVAGSPGANDNGAAVFMLVEAAMRLRKDGVPNWLIVFTDKEELTAGEGIVNQGAYTLARAFGKTLLKNAPFFIFDACGRGNTIIISTTADSFLKNEGGAGAARAKKNMQDLRSHALKAAHACASSRIMLLPTPFSDDAGFFRAGLAAQTITVLPEKEAALLASFRAKALSSGAFISREAAPGLPLPETWRLLNSAADTARTLEPANIPGIVRFAVELAGNR